ncbi:hypothetical protein F2A31_14220 [Acinetobacter suaedae]|uniref:Uncharacterized protein n=1 Tax=Acinetobacter suaedae TaxID=2609668 RepID=A0A5P1UXF5_9GAMM|nr:hypothetical protein F2A31_14220 [Acinetobacter sp. C16S1]
MGHQPFCVTIIGSFFVSFAFFAHIIRINGSISNAYQYFFAYKNIVKRFNTTKNCSICKQWWPYRPA